MKATIIALFALADIVAGGSPFGKLTVTATDSTGAVASVDLSADEVPVTNPDGSLQYEIPVDVAAGSISLTAQAFAADGTTLGTAMTGTGSLTDTGGGTPPPPPPPAQQFPQVSSLSIKAA